MCRERSLWIVAMATAPPPTTKEELAATYPEHRAVCRCGHRGDVPRATPIALRNEHVGAQGLGACTFPGCQCPGFVWVAWSPEYAQALEALS
jgi:hypothetical protein